MSKQQTDGHTLYLLIEEKGVRRRYIPLESDAPKTYLLGRESNDVDIAIPHKAVSRNHAVIEWNGKFLSVKDSNSTNGVWIDGIRIESSAKVESGSSITFSASCEWRIIVSSHLQGQAAAASGKEIVILGRNGDCDICIDSPNISRKHARLRRICEGKYEISDLSSTNGTFVNGVRISSPRILADGDRITIGKFVYIAGRNGLTEQGHSGEAALVLTNVTTVRSGKRILNDVSISIPEKSFVAIMGPSGCGKSTLLKAMNGSEPASYGTVLLNGYNLYREYDSLKPQIGYVPQDDIVHGGLSVHDALYYAARMRLPEDLDRTEIERRIDAVMAQLHIGAIRNSLIKTISGGERKRVSIAVELLSDPAVLFLDEPTSPLDPQTIEEFLMILRGLTEDGVTVIMVTHKPDDLNYADQIIFLAKNGYLAFFGTSNRQEYLNYFKVDNVVQVYARLFKEDGAVLASTYKKHRHISGEQEQDTGSKAHQGQLRRKRTSGILAQIHWLTLRQFRIRFNDKRNTAILLLQAPIIAVLAVLVFNTRSISAVFLMVISAIWFGCNNAVREIVSEWPIYKRERMYNLNLFSYIVSKIFPNFILAAIQVALFMVIVTEPLNILYPFETYLALLLAAFTSILMGLLISAFFDSSDKAMAILPIVLIPQIVFSGVIAPLTSSILDGLGYLMISRWAVNLVINIQKTVIDTAGNPMFSQVVINNAFGKNLEDGDLIIALAVILAVTLVALAIVLKRKDAL